MLKKSQAKGFVERCVVAVVLVLCLLMTFGCAGINGTPECTEQMIIDAQTSIDKDVDPKNPISKEKAAVAKKDLDKSWDDYKAQRISCKELRDRIDYYLK